MAVDNVVTCKDINAKLDYDAYLYGRKDNVRVESKQASYSVL